MDAVLAAELAVNVAQFLDFATQCLFADERKWTDNEITNLIHGLQQRAANVQYELPHGVNLLSQEDEICFRLANQCRLVSSQILSTLELLKTTGSLTHVPAIRELHSNEYLKSLLEGIGKNLKEQLAPYLWATISHDIRELGAKNSRLNVNRTKEIEQLTFSNNSCFQMIKASEKCCVLDKWSQILVAVQLISDLSAEQAILSALQFWTMDRRKGLISKEHKSTFEWILAKDPSADLSLPAVNFTDWLRTDVPIYWISGLPGSGKSTLMKFIAESPKTVVALKEWAQEDELITASYYFWSSAKDPLQKSDTGLLRSILVQILRQCPELIPYAFPVHWKERRDAGALRRLSQIEITITELLAAYQRIAGLLVTTNFKFCFFIDGLDEYDGEPSDIILLIAALSKTQHLKVCISSRPWTQFENVFGGKNPWKLYVHQLTKADMKVYVEDLLGSNERFRNMEKYDDTESLKSGIVEGAEGVFLWVFLVVRFLLNGLSNTDRVIDLQKRVATIPNNLDKYFDKMLLDIDPGKRKQTAQIFDVTLHAAEKLPLMSYWFIQEDTLDNITAMEPQPLSKSTAVERLDQARIWLDTFSEGLLKANELSGEYNISSSGLEEHQWLFGFRVDFLHRTVADFLRTAHMQRLLSKWLSGSFDVDMQICKASLATIKITPPTNSMFGEASRALQCLHLFMHHAANLYEQTQTMFIDELVSTLKIYHGNLDNIVALILGPGNYWAYESSFNLAILYHCVSYSLGKYVALQLDSGKLSFPEPPSALLSGCFSFDNRVRMDKFTPNIDTIELLLHRGLTPNLPWGDRNFSFWQQLLTTTYSRHLKGMTTQADFDAIKCSFEHAANLEALVEVFSGRRMGSTKAVDIVEKVLPKEQFLALRLSGMEL